MKTRTPVSLLTYTQIDTTPCNFDWSKGYAEAWEFYEAATRDSEEETPEDADPKFATNFDGSEHHFDGPMMNYFYPLKNYRGDPREDCKKLAHLPVCIVEFLEDDGYALALTGGGMDLSWEICEAFMLLGFLPPVHFASDLPRMCGRGTSARDRWIVAGARRSLQGMKARACSALRRLRGNFQKVTA